MDYYIVTCENGMSEMKLTLWEAREWAEWGHCCTIRHTIEGYKYKCKGNFDVYTTDGKYLRTEWSG